MATWCTSCGGGGRLIHESFASSGATEPREYDGSECPRCEGTGREPETRCKNCDGTGYIQGDDDNLTGQCPDCKGEGVLPC